MVQRSSTVGRADILAVLTDYYNVIESMVLEGWTVNTPMANFRQELPVGRFFSGRRQMGRGRSTASAFSFDSRLARGTLGSFTCTGTGGIELGLVQSRLPIGQVPGTERVGNATL